MPLRLQQATDRIAAPSQFRELAHPCANSPSKDRWPQVDLQIEQTTAVMRVSLDRINPGRNQGTSLRATLADAFRGQPTQISNSRIVGAGNADRGLSNQAARGSLGYCRFSRTPPRQPDA